MPKVQIKNRELWVGSKPISLVSGEMHYWRLNPSFWSAALDQAKKLGIDLISTYVPWEYHEVKRGKFDFTGRTDPSRNLKGFLELTRRKGFRVILRPGPYIYSEWPNDGVPDYAHAFHRLHEKFLASADIWLREVAKIIRPFLATKAKGHIVLIQADNEIDPWPDRFGHQYGLGAEPGLFQEFLKESYRDNLEGLNESWGETYSSFEKAGPFIASMGPEESGLPLKGDRELRRNLDYLRFKHEYSRRAGEAIIQRMRKLGFDVPIFLNLYPFFYVHDWQAMQSVSDAVGIDCYPTNEFREDAFEHRKFMDKIRFLSRISKLPFIAEFESGIWHEKHYESGVFSPNHYRLLALSALLGGIVGWNWYMLVNRDNWYMAPINEWGRTRPELFAVFRQLVELFRKCHPSRWEKITEVGVTFHPLQYAAKSLSHASPILVSLYEYDIDYDLYDPEQGVFEKPYLFYEGNQWLSERAQRNLKKYVEGGGTLIAFKNFPRKDGNFHPLSLIGFEDPQSILFEFKNTFKVQLAPGRPKVQVTSSVYTFEAAHAQAIRADLAPYGRMTIGYTKQIGKGKIIHLGVDPSRELILEILNYLEVPLVSYSKTPGIKTAVFKRAGSYFLVAINNGLEGKNASILIPALERHAGRFRVIDLLEGSSEIYSQERCHPFSIEIPCKDGRIIEFQPI